MTSAKLLYIQTVKVYTEMVELYQQFLLKLTKAYSDLAIDRPWKVYENVFGEVSDFRDFIFIRGLDFWSELDQIATEDGISKIMAKVFGENETIRWMQVVQKAVKSIDTRVISTMDQY